MRKIEVLDMLSAISAVVERHHYQMDKNIYDDLRSAVDHQFLILDGYTCCTIPEFLQLEDYKTAIWETRTPVTNLRHVKGRQYKCDVRFHSPDELVYYK